MQQQSLFDVYGGMKADYRAARGNRYIRKRKGLPSMGAGFDYHYRSEYDYLRLMEQARDSDRNDMVMGQMVDRSVDNVMGEDGFGYDPDTGDEVLNDYLKKIIVDEWMSDPDQCDSKGEDDFGQLSRLAFRQHLVDGDHWGFGTEIGAIQCQEAHRIRTPSNTSKKVVHGVLLDENGRRNQAWVTKEPVDPRMPLARVSDTTQIPFLDDDGFRQVFQVYTKKRSSQTRGVTAFAPIFEPLGQFDDIMFAELVKRQMAACVTMWMKVKNKWASDPNSAVELANSGREILVEQMSPGQIRKIGLEEDMQGFSPNIPGEGFFEHMRLVLMMISINFGLPLQVVLLDPRDTNFSGWRGAIDQAKIGFRRNQRMMVCRWYKPIVRWKISQLLEFDETLQGLVAGLEDPGDVYKCKWKLPRWPYIEPKKDAEAREIRRRTLQTSPRRLSAEDGVEFDEIAREIPEDNAMHIRFAHEAAQQLNEELDLEEGERLTWRDLLFLTPPKTAVNIGSEPPEKKPNQQGSPDDGDDADE